MISQIHVQQFRNDSWKMTTSARKHTIYATYFTATNGMD